MTDQRNELLLRIYDRIRELLADGKTIEAIRYLREISRVSLLDAKNVVLELQSGKSPEMVGEGFGVFLSFLESSDFASAAASLCVYHLLTAADAIRTTLRTVEQLKLDIDLSSSEGSILLDPESTSAQQFVNELAIAMVKEKAIRGLMKRSGESREVATQIVEKFEVPASHYARSPTVDERVDPPETVPHTTARLHANDKTLRRTIGILGKVASIIYGLIALSGISGLAYSYFTSPQRLETFEMREDLSPSEQATRIQEWTSRTIPATITWFFPLNRYLSLRLEPGLPAEYSYLELTWEEKLTHVNASTAATLSTFFKCHTVLLVYYLMAIGLSVWCIRQLSIISGILMTSLGLLGVPWLTAGFIRLDVENSIWFAPLLLPGTLVMIAAVAELALVPDSTDWQQHRRGFWIGAFALVVTGVLLGLAFQSGSHLKSNAGIGVLGGLLLVVRHGWGMIQCGMRRKHRNAGAM